MSFVRRFGSFPSSQVISEIEGVVIVDLPPPASIQGVATGVVGVVGEFADVRYATEVDGSGNVKTKIRPVEVTSAQDMLNKVGGWDETLGEFGKDDGNGFVAIRNKRFSRLVIAPVNLASDKATRIYRELPTNKSAVLAMPTVAMAPATVKAGTTFKTSTGKLVKLATSVSFTSFPAIASGLDGVQTAETGATVTFTSATGDFVNRGVQVGDALVLGVIGGDGVPGTYRITAVTNATTLEVQALDGSSVTWTAVTALPYRVHPASTFDSAGSAGRYVNLANVSGYTLPARPLEVTVSAASLLTPVATVFEPTATSWDPLAGLTMVTHPTGALTYTANVQEPNVDSTAEMGVLYQQAIDAMLADVDPIRDVSVIYAARTSSGIRSYLAQHVLSASAQGRGRIACIGPGLDTVDETTVLGATSPGVGATASERVLYCWPGVKTNIPEAVGYSIPLADGSVTTDGLLDVRFDGFVAGILSNLASERNPGQATDPIPLCLAGVLGFQSALMTDFTIQNYTLFRQYGVMAIRFDRGGVKSIQSGITSSQLPGQKNVNRRRMADEIQDSLAQAYLPLTKLPMTDALKDAIDVQTNAYLEGLRSPNNPAGQRIEAYQVDSKSGNTPELNAAGIYVVIVRVRMLGTMDDIVIQSEIGPTVNVTTV